MKEGGKKKNKEQEHIFLGGLQQQQALAAVTTAHTSAQSVYPPPVYSDVWNGGTNYSWSMTPTNSSYSNAGTIMSNAIL